MTANPYKNVWDSSGDHYGSELVKNGAAFMPTFLELAMRSKGTAKYYLRKARQLNASGYHTEARATLQEALSHQRIAKAMMAKHTVVLANSR